MTLFKAVKFGFRSLWAILHKQLTPFRLFQKSKSAQIMNKAGQVMYMYQIEITSNKNTLYVNMRCWSGPVHTMTIL